MKAVTQTGIYQVINVGRCFFAGFKYNDGEVLFLSKPYRNEKNAEKRLINHCAAANVKLS